jgi:hypothetical protein
MVPAAPKTTSGKRQRAARHRTQRPTSNRPLDIELKLDSSIPATQFQLFSSLPPDLRLQIWKLSLPPRPIRLPCTDPKLHLIKGFKKLRRFHLFPLLPKDLRMQIWDLALPPPRLLQVRLVPQQSRWIHTRWWRAETGPSSWIVEDDGSNPNVFEVEDTMLAAPVHLGVNREARAFAMGRYQQTLIWDRYRSWSACSWGWRSIWVEPARDIFYFSANAWKDVTNEDQYQRVRQRFPVEIVKHLYFQSTSRVLDRSIDSNRDEPPNVATLQKEADISDAKQLISMAKRFPNLRECWLVIDWRRTWYSGDHLREEFVDPTEDYEDYLVEDGRREYLEGFQAMAGGLAPLFNCVSIYVSILIPERYRKVEGRES